MTTRIFGRGSTATDKTGHKDNAIWEGSTNPEATLASFGDNADQTVALINKGFPLPYTETDVWLLRFDISALAGTTITSATLRVVCSTPSIMANPVTVSVCRGLTAWGKTDTDAGTVHDPADIGEACFSYALTGKPFPPPPIAHTYWAAGMGFTWSMLDAQVLGAPTFTVDPGDPNDTTYAIDVTSIVQSWLDGTNPNHGFSLLVVTPSDTDDDVAWFLGHGEADAARRPALEIVYPDPEPPVVDTTQRRKRSFVLGG